jgi:hypothetical protein
LAHSRADVREFELASGDGIPPPICRLIRPPAD